MFRDSPASALHPGPLQTPPPVANTAVAIVRALTTIGLHDLSPPTEMIARQSR
jgi:hypothetical protein